MLNSFKDYLLIGTGLFIIFMIAFYQVKLRYVENEKDQLMTKVEQLQEFIATQNAAILVMKQESDKQKAKLKSAENAASTLRQTSKKSVDSTMSEKVSKDCKEALKWAVKQTESL